jgi:hypothetical protein
MGALMALSMSVLQILQWQGMMTFRDGIKSSEAVALIRL